MTGFANQVERYETVLTPRVDLYESDVEFILEAELPGVQKEQLSLSLQERQLVLEATRSSDEEHETVYRRSFHFRVPLEEEKIVARLDKGVLRLQLPKAPEVQPRTIEVQTV